MNVLGTGLISARGRGAESLAEDWQAPEFVEVPFQDDPFPVYTVKPETLKDRSVLGGMRRADRFSKMAVLAAHDAVVASGVEFSKPERVGIILATALGPHNTTFKFLDDILDYGDAGVSPIVFSNAVHNAAVSYVSRTLGIKGPTWTVTKFKNPFEEAAQLAQVWLDQGRCDYILLGGGDECGTVMEYICSQKLPIASDGKVGADAYVPGEGMAFFVVGNDKDGGVPFDSSNISQSKNFGNMLTGSALDAAATILSAG